MAVVYLIGAGLGQPELLTGEARAAIEQSQCLFGAERVLAPWRRPTQAAYAVYQPEEIAALLAQHPKWRQAAVLFSGDIGFYSGARNAAQALADHDLRYISGISSLVYFCNTLGLPWEDVRTVSLHGRENDWLGQVQCQAKTFLLLDKAHPARLICQALARQALPQIQVAIGQQLSYPDQRILRGAPEEFVDLADSSLEVMLVLNARPQQAALPGISDDAFSRAQVPMTKEEVRLVAVGKLRLRPTDVVYDVGSGTGAMTVEIARLIPAGQVYAVEVKEEAQRLTAQNVRQFGLCNVRLVGAQAPEALEALPAADAVFIGGSGGELAAILALIRRKNPAVRVVLNAITLETALAAVQALAGGFADIELVQLQLSKGRLAGEKHMLLAQNPIFIISVQGKGEAAL